MKKSMLLGVLLGSMIMLSACQSTSTSGSDASILDTYPEDTVEFIVPAAGGAVIDIATRTMMESLNQTFAKPAVIVNMSGASQTTGIAEAAKRDGDGYTFVTGAPAGLLSQPHITTLSYGLDDFRHLVLLNGGISTMIVTPEGSAYTSWDDLKAAMEGGRLTYSSSNTGGTGHLAMLAVLKATGLEAEYVPFDGTAEGTAALLGNHIDFYVMDMNDALSRMDGGQILPILLMDAERNEKLPDVLCAGDVGIDGMENYRGYWWIAAQKDTPDEIVEYMKEQIYTAMQSEAYLTYLENAYLEPADNLTEEEVTAQIYGAAEAYGEIIKSMSTE